MIEPWITPVSALIYKWLHHEPCHPQAPRWAFPDSGPLSMANSALPWMVFKRDDAIRHARYPQLRIDGIRPHTPLRYLLSGGVSSPVGAPAAAFTPACRLEAALAPAMGWLAMFATIVVTRQSSD